MSSRKIAELTSKCHDNVVADIKKMLADLVEGLLKFQDTYRTEQNGQLYPCFNFPKRETMILVSGYSVVLRSRIVDRWMELEAQAQDMQCFSPARNCTCYKEEDAPN
jgi:phage regulator Rha-like protein